MNWEHHKYNIDINIKNELFRSYMMRKKRNKNHLFLMSKDMETSELLT